MDISTRIVRSRRSDKEIALACGTAIPVVWLWRQGKTRPHIRFIAALAGALECDVEDLIPPPPAPEAA